MPIVVVFGKQVVLFAVQKPAFFAPEKRLADRCAAVAAEPLFRLRRYEYVITLPVNIIRQL